VPKHWPSRIRVTIQSAINALVGFGIFKFLTAADVGYLDLSEPVNPDVLCLSSWPERTESDMWIRDDSYAHWVNAVFSSDDFVQTHQCPIEVEEASTDCQQTRIPVTGLQQRNLGHALGGDINANSDVLGAYSGLFGYLGLCLFVTTTVHDLSLLTVKEHNSVLDIQGTRKQFPCLLHWGFLLAGIPCVRSMIHNDRKGMRILGKLVIPLVAVWSIFVFTFVWWPVSVLAYLVHPIKLSRLAVFANSLLFTVYGLGLTLHSLVWWGTPEWRPMFAITWEPAEGQCYCGCVYPMSRQSVLQILLIGATVIWKGFMNAFRCLKGLRRSNWANLLTVMFPVPLAVYPVMWTQPDGSAINLRKEGEPVQGELGFDPFALMDEQPTSRFTTLRLEPVSTFGLPTDERESSRSLEICGPVLPMTKTTTLSGDQIGCCGFPLRNVSHPRSPKPEKEPESADSAAEAEPTPEKKERSD